MGRLVAIALNTFREAVRDRILYGILFFAIAFLLFILVLGELSLHQEERVLLDVGVAGISLFAVAASTPMAASRDRRRPAGRPASRWAWSPGSWG